eukprot:SAG11_NODE_2395_length_3406_cov_9.604475_5_plen_148_part_00
MGSRVDQPAGTGRVASACCRCIRRRFARYISDSSSAPTICEHQLFSSVRVGGVPACREWTDRERAIWCCYRRGARSQREGAWRSQWASGWRSRAGRTDEEADELELCDGIDEAVMRVGQHGLLEVMAPHRAEAVASRANEQLALGNV